MNVGRRRVASLLLAFLVAWVLAACAGLPTGGEVRTQQIGADDDGDPLVTLADGPQPGASPEQLLAGFLTAQRAPAGDYQVAREFLTDSFRAVWSPIARVLVSDSAVLPVVVAEDLLRVTVEVQAVVNSTGNYSTLDTSDTQELEFAFARNADGEWRIDEAPDGTLLSSNRFASTFGAYPLYFYDTSGDYLVPDVRWFPDTASRADRIVTELLRGQSTWYANGVLVTAFPADTKLDGGVTIDAGAASVDLSSEVAAQTPEARWRMKQQLVASLSLGDVSSVQITVGGLPLDAGTGTQPDRTLPVASNPIGLSEGQFGYLSRAGVQPVDELSSRIEALEPQGVTLGRDAASAAVRAGTGSWLVTAESDPVLLDAREGLIDPGLDRGGYLWSALSGDVSHLTAYASDGAAHPFATPYLDGVIVALEVSRDSTRLLVATQSAAGPAVTIIGIVRDAEGVPVGLGEPLEVAIAAGTMVDATWVDSSTVATLMAGDESTRVDLSRIGGKREAFGSLVGGVQLVGGNLSDGIRVRDAEGGVWRHSSSGGWQQTGIVASFLGTQQ